MPVKEGSELTLECAAEGGNPPPVLAWGMTLSQATLDGPEQPPDNLTVLPSTSGRRSGAHLKVLRGHHNATITCVARHITLTMPMNASILLDVQCEYPTTRRRSYRSPCPAETTVLFDANAMRGIQLLSYLLLERDIYM